MAYMDALSFTLLTTSPTSLHAYSVPAILSSFMFLELGQIIGQIIILIWPNKRPDYSCLLILALAFSSSFIVTNDVGVESRTASRIEQVKEIAIAIVKYKITRPIKLSI